MIKRFNRVIALTLVALSSLAASAGSFSFGPIVGVNINKFSTNVSDNFSASNRCGFTGGVMAKFTVPVIGIGVDLSAMYARRSSEVNGEKINYDYIAVPLHLRYDIGLPVVGKVVSPAIFVGPNFAFRCSDNIVSDFNAKKYNVGMDFGVAVTLLSHLQIAGSYTLNLNKAINFMPGIDDVKGASIKGSTSGWTVTAAYLF